MAIEITSPVFRSGMIPAHYTCDGDDVSPPLSWGDVPEGARSLALIADDPDAPGKTWVHWVIYNLPPDTRELPEDMRRDKTLPNGARQGKNDFNKIGYGGPCLPGGTHRYFFRIYALDREMDLEPGATKKKLLQEMEDHILAQGELMGKYGR